MGNHEYPPLWQHRSKDHSPAPTMKLLMEEFSSRPQPTPWRTLFKNTLVVGQEFTLTCFFLARHRTAQYEEQGLIVMTGENYGELKQAFSLAAIPVALLIVALFSDSQRSRQKTKTRLVDALLMAVLLRFLAAVLRTLTASYSSDTVHALAIAGMVIHLLGCDYSYANGGGSATHSTTGASISRKGVSPFLGGTMSLNAAFFATTLLASRLVSNWTVHFFVSSSVTIFAFYPATRHGLFVKSSDKAPFVLILSTIILATATWVHLENLQECILFSGTLATICLVAPTWKYAYLQHYKVHINGPWDIAHISLDE